MKKNSILLTYLILLFFSCKELTDKVVYESPVFNEIIPKAAVIYGDTIDALPQSSAIIDSFLILRHESMKNEHYFQVYNRLTGKYILSFGDKGRGYGELVNVASVSIDNHTKSMYVSATNQSRAVIFNLDSLGYGKVRISELKLKQPLSSIGFFRLGQNNFLTTYNPYNRFALYDNKLNVIDTCDYYSPTTTGIKKDYPLTNYYFSTSDNIVKPDGTRFANITSCGAIFEIFGIEQNKLVHITTNYFYQPTYDKSGDPLWNKCTFGARTICATNRYIYIVLNGTNEDYARLEKISVYDWDGHPVKQYDLGVNIMRITIDEEAGLGYVILRDDSLEYRLGYFDL